MVTRFLVRVDPGDGVPLYRQIAEQVKAAIAAGALRPGDRMPSHRDLARDIVVAPLTVSRAYETLEREGLLATERGRGTFVTALGQVAAAAPQAEEELRGRAEALIRQARALGLSRRDIARVLGEAWRKKEARDE